MYIQDTYNIAMDYTGHSYNVVKQITHPMAYEPESSMPHSQALSNNPYPVLNQPNWSHWYLFL